MAKTITQLLLGTDERLKLLEDLETRFTFGDDPQTVADDFIAFGSNLEKEFGTAINDAISNGLSFTAALEGWFPEIVIEAIRMGETSGNFGKGCKYGKEALEATSESVMTFFMTIGKPILFIVSVFAMIGLISVNLMGTLGSNKPMNQWPLVSVSVYDFGHNLVNNWGLYLCLVIFCVICLFIALTNWTGQSRNNVRMSPLFRQYNLVMALRIINGFAQLRSIGLSLDESVEIMLSSTGLNRYTRYHLEEVQGNIQLSEVEGVLGRLLDTGMLEERMVNRLNRVTNPAITDVRLLKQTATEIYRLYKRQLARTSAVMAQLNRAIGVALFLWMMAGCLFLAIPDM
ncbi:hypothetical protein HUO09_17040 [Vibrio sp. Y2-5]|uniref:hypothetical protein n=1 Tax=Vibrio sp. Y2-5 TaxID=2743977 RepID=UPI00166172EF|nr:hypothetical protein [Vibrio sp. Y2-5]MBD0788062.1 hypothetical protein [Vibrio sp. Y2-5]